MSIFSSQKTSNLYRFLSFSGLIFVFVTWGCLNVISQEESEIGIMEKLDSMIYLDAVLVNENDSIVQLRDIIDRPTVLSFVYYRCPGICTPLMDGIADVIGKADLKLGEEYQVVTISFDPRETTELAVRKKKNYINQLSKVNAADGWLFFTGDSANIKKLTESAGFNYKSIGNDFIHAAALIILSPNGKITRYLNGTYFLPFEFKLAVLEASEGKSGPTINKILQYCYSYDPSGQKYVLNITRISGTLILIVAFIIFISLGIRPLLRKKRKAN